MSLDKRLENVDSKLNPKPIKISEDEIKRLVRKFVFDENFDFEETELKFEIIKEKKCDLKTADSIFQKMKDLGLAVCYNWRIGFSLRKFADMRDYLTDDEFKKIDQEIIEREKKEDAHEAKFIEKYGADKSKWSDDVWDEYEYGEEE